MRFNFILVRSSYQLLYIQTLLQDKLISPVRFLPFSSFQKQLSFKSNLLSSDFLMSFLHRFTCKKIRKNIRITPKSFSFFLPLLQKLKVTKNSFSFYQKYCTSFTFSFIKVLRRSRIRCNSSFGVRSFPSLYYPLRLLNLCSFVQILPNLYFERKYRYNLVLQLYLSFFLLYSSSLNDEVNISTFLRFFLSKYIISSSFCSNVSLLHKFLFNSFFFNTFSKCYKKRSLSKYFIRRKASFYKYSKRFLCSFLRQRAQLRFRFKKKSNTVQPVRSRLLKARNCKLRCFKSVLQNKKFKLFNSYRWYSFFNNLNFMRSTVNIKLAHAFVHNFSRFVFRSSLLNVKRTSYFNSFSLKKKYISFASNRFLFSFYKKRRLFQLRRFLRRVRFFNKNTYHLYLKGTGSNIYSTFLRNDRVLYSMWSGLFGLKKRLKYRKGAGHKISHFFHRYISVLYKQKRIYKLNLIINGFSKFLSICLDALNRQLSYTANYYLRTERYPHRLTYMIKRMPSYYSNKLKKKWSFSFLKSFISSFTSSHLTTNLNNLEIRSLVPELSVNDLTVLTNIISNDNISRSNFLLRLIRSRRYIKRIAPMFDSLSMERSVLVNKLINIFMDKYKISSKKDLYSAIASLNKYRSVLLNSSHTDQLDFISAYSILYLLQLLKQNELSFDKMVSYSFLLKRRFSIYLRKIRRLKRKVRKLKRKKNKRIFSFYKKNKKNKKKHQFKAKDKAKAKAFKITKNKKKKKRSSFVSNLVRDKFLSSSVLLKGKSINLSTLFNLFSYRLLRSKKFMSSLIKYLKTNHFNVLLNSSLKAILFKLFILFVRRIYTSHSFTLRTPRIKKLYNALFLKCSSKCKISSRRKMSSYLKKKRRRSSYRKLRFKSAKQRLISNYIQNSLSSLIDSSSSLLDLKLSRQPNRLRFKVRRLFKSRRRLLLIKRFPRKRMQRLKSRVIVRRPRGSFFYKKNGKRRRFSKICRSIRTRMRNFTQLIYSIGYVKYRASLSHGGCAARKRYYDKRYIL